MRIAPHCGTVTPVISFPQDKVIVCRPVFAAWDSIVSTGSLAAAPILAAFPAATWTVKSLKYGCWARVAFIAWHDATVGRNQTVWSTALAKRASLYGNGGLKFVRSFSVA